MRYEVREEFDTELRAWFENTTHEERKVSGKRFLVGTTSETLKSIGVKDYKIYMGGAKIDKILTDNASMTLDTIADAVMLLDSPILIMKSLTVEDSIVLFGEVYTNGEKPVMISVLLSPKTNSGEILDYAVITSAYGRTKNNLQNMINRAKIYYVNEQKNRTDKWLKALGLQLPSAITKYGPIDTIEYSDPIVNSESAEAMDEAQKNTTDDGGVDGEYDIKLSPREENAFKSYAKEINYVVNQSISGKGNIDGKAQVKDIMPTGPRITAMVSASSENAIDISQRNIALSSSDIWHEYKRHTQATAEVSRGQIAFTKRQFQNAVKCIISPDIVETIFSDTNNPTQRQSFAYAKKTARGHYVVVEAVGGKKNPQIYPVLIVQFSKAKWNKMMSEGKSLGEMLHEGEPQKLLAQDVEKNKKSRVTAAQFASYEAIANTLRSPQLDTNISQTDPAVKNESSEAMDLEMDEKTESVAPSVMNSDRDYSYDTLISKPDMVVTTVDSNVPKNRADVVVMAKKNAARVGRFNPKTGNVSVHIKDIEADVFLGRDGLRHSIDRRFNVNAPVVLKAGEILSNSIKINELTPKKEKATESYVLIGAARNDSGELFVVRSVVNRFTHNLTSMDVLYAINAKKEPAALLPLSTGKPALGTDSTVSIAELLDYVNKYFPDILPEDVLKHFGHESRPEGSLGEDALYSERDSESVSNRSLLANAFEGVAQNEILLSRFGEKVAKSRVKGWHVLPHVMRSP